MSKFEVGDGYKTRDGGEAGIYWIGPESMHGWESNSVVWRVPTTWHLDGRVSRHYECQSDLMPKEVPLLECDVVVKKKDGSLVCVASPDKAVSWGDQFRIIRMREVRE